MSHSSTELFIRNFQQGDMPLLGELYQAVNKIENTVFWWVGEEHQWSNVYCAFEAGKMIAKGQVSIINVVPPGRSKDNKHSIYVNLKATPERADDYDLLNRVYKFLYNRAVQLKGTFPIEYRTMLCVGNDSKETANNDFFIQKGFLPLNQSYGLNRDLNQPILELKLHDQFEFAFWKMETADEEKEYLRIEGEIWPDTPLLPNKLTEFRNNKLWTSMVIRQSDTIIAGLMVWQEDAFGIIEDVFVREPFRKRGLAKYLLTQAMKYLKANQIQHASIDVFATNKSALSLYESVGFKLEKEELRYFINLD